MPKNKGRNNKNKKQNKQNKNKNKQKQPMRGNRKARSRRSPLGKYAMMLADPCAANLVPGIFGTTEGLLARMRTTISFNEQNGYIAWCPNYCASNGTATGHYNFVWYGQNFGSSVNPTNTTVNPFGTNYTTSGGFLQDPAYNFLSGATAADHRTISACLSLVYTGSISSCSGEIALLPNVGTSVLLSGGSGGVPASIDDLFTHAPIHNRLSIEAAEIKFHPGAQLPRFHASRTGPLYYQAANATTLAPSVAASGDPGWVVLAWRNVPATSIRVMATKCFEWRPEANVGLLSVTPKSTTPMTTFHDAVRMLDTVSPEWWAMAKHGVSALASRVAALAFTGTEPGLIAQTGRLMLTEF